MKKNLILAFFLLTTPGIACINEFHTLINGQVVESEGLVGIHVRDLNHEVLKRELSELRRKYNATPSFEVKSDIGAILIYLGRYDEAIALYREIEQVQPGIYAVASNMGTAFELTGQNDSALHYIKKAIKIDPKSHRSSEWIHVKILEAKIRFRNNPDSLQYFNILGLDFGVERKPNNVNALNLEELEKQIRFQLSERMAFVKPKDVIVGQILFELGNVTALTHDVQTALAAYALAHDYGFESDLMSSRNLLFRVLAFKATVMDNMLLIVASIVLIIAISIFIWLMIRLFRRIRSNRIR
ncbi:MAG TPA: tetratricopeptide repeat protein [Ohtaekwangia sp.]